MRSAHCTVLAALLVAGLAAATASQPAPPPGAVGFRIFVRGRQVGTEQVAVTRTAAGNVIAGTGRLNPPLDIVTNRCEVRYDAQWKPLEATVDAIVRGQYTSVHTLFNDGSAVTQILQGSVQAPPKTDKIAGDNVVLMNSFFGLYEALAARLQNAAAGDEIKAYVLPVAEIAIKVNEARDERLEAPGQSMATKHYVLALMNPGGAVSVDLWAQQGGGLLRMAIPAQGFEMVREDVATVAARMEIAPRANDEQVRIPATGFTLAATVSRPSTPAATAKPGGAALYPAVILVGSATAPDREETTADVPIFAQISGALADAGFLVVRYDRRGAGQSGGRAESITVEQLGDDARSVVAYVRARKDVDRNRIALVGYTEGGWAAMLAAAKNKDVAALALIATPGVTGAQLTLAQQEHMLDAMKMPPAERQAKIDLQKKIQQAVLSGTGWQDVPANLRKQSDTLWFHSFLAFDPAKVMPSIKQPILIVAGDLDRQTFPPLADRLAELAKARKAPAGAMVSVVHVPGVNHLLVPATTGETDEYARLTDKSVSKDALSAIADWLKKTPKS